MAQEVLQVSRLHQDSRFNHRLRRARQRCVLQDLLRKEMGTARIRIRMRIRILTNRRPVVSYLLLYPLWLPYQSVGNSVELRGLVYFLWTSENFVCWPKTHFSALKVALEILFCSFLRVYLPSWAFVIIGILWYCKIILWEIFLCYLFFRSIDFSKNAFSMKLIENIWDLIVVPLSGRKKSRLAGLSTILTRPQSRHQPVRVARVAAAWCSPPSNN